MKWKKGNKKIDRLGFTLLELIIAVCLLAVLLVGLYVIFQQSQSASEKGYRRVEMYQNIRVCLDMMIRELKSSFLSSGDERLVFLGETQSLTFATVSQEINQSNEYDLCEVTYDLKNCQVRRKVRKLSTSSAGSRAVLADYVFRLEFAYNNGEDWQNSWDSRQATPDNLTDDLLPRAVRIIIFLQQTEENPISLSTTVYLPQS